MPLNVALYLRHLATRCSRMSRDCNDPVVTKELVIISIELVEKAAALEAQFTIPNSTDDTHDPSSGDIIAIGDDHK
jgi:hypothetical protein